MAAQSLQQTLSKARNAQIAHAASIGLALALLVAGVVAYRNATGASDASRVESPHAVALRSPASPALWSTGSAYDGGAYGSVQAPASAETRSPIRRADSSAYDGDAYGSVLPVASQRVHDVPALHSTGSAYDGQ